MRAKRKALLLIPVIAVACAGNPNKQTLAKLHKVEPDMKEVAVEDGLQKAMVGYRSFLQEAPESSLTPEAMRRLADLKIEKEFGILGGGDIPAPKTTAIATPTASTVEGTATDGPFPAAIADHSESENDFIERVASEGGVPASGAKVDLELPGEKTVEWAGPEEAIELYDRILAAYPNYEHNDQVLYQKARAFDELGETDKAIRVVEDLIAKYPNSFYLDEAQFRRGEYFFTRRKYLEAELAYSAVTAFGPSSPYFEIALYKLGWSLYKQEMHDEALDQYIALLDYKISTGYDFDQPDDDSVERRIADTYRVISLSFSSLGGHTSVEEYFAQKGARSYEDRIYSHLGEFYLEKRRYNDAAGAYKAFVRLHPLHKTAPHFGIRIVEIYETGGFPKLVLESKMEFAQSYALGSEFWTHFDVTESPEVIDYLRGNLEDLATHYHAVFQDKKHADERPENFQQALRWYREYLASFPAEPKTPGIHYRLADLLLEHENFGVAAREYEHTAYAYDAHEQSAAAGYAAIFAHREHQKHSEGEAQEAVRAEAVTSTLRFVDTFPEHEHAPVVLGAAVDDLYDMKDYTRAVAIGGRLIQDYPKADPAIVRAAWAAVAHSHFDTEDYVQAEQAYSRVLELTEAEDKSRQDVVENLAAAIYKQGEKANLEEDYRSAANHFLRIPELAPTSDIRPAAEYDAGAALIKLEDWDGAAAVLETFRDSHPDHELRGEATKQIAFVYRSAGNLSRAGEEYERVAAEADEPELRSEALLLAGELYEESRVLDRALAVYLRYVKQFPKPLETVVETRFKIAELYEEMGDEKLHREQLEKIVALDKGAGSERSDRVRNIAARSALALTVDFYERFDDVKLVQPFDTNLQKKQKRMDEALAAFEALVDYEVGEATAGATYYIAEVYYEFSQALLESERPDDLSGADLLDYEMVLEEEAFPFEERALEVHEKNLELMSVGVYNRWIEKSLYKLADLMPGRYAKFEESSGPIASLERYAYHVPELPVEAAEQPQSDRGEQSDGTGQSDDTNPGDGTGESVDPEMQPEITTGVESVQLNLSANAVAAG